MSVFDYLRYGFAGGIFIASSAWTLDSRELARVLEFAGARAVPMVAAALLVGCIIYVAHRALLYPLVYRAFLLVFRRTYEIPWRVDLLVPYRPAQAEVALDVQRWKMASCERSAQGGLREWAAQVHFLYCSAWAVLGAALFGGELTSRIMRASVDSSRAGSLVFVGLLVLAVSLLHHYRYLRFDFEVAKIDGRVPRG